ncbi:hypothetical protein HER39_08745, partial [Arthrobacter deserti]|nr:hypothetical protein [Arthrobacter deserti]
MTAAAPGRAAAAAVSAAGLLVLGLVCFRSFGEPPQPTAAAAASVLLLVLSWQLRGDTPLLRRHTTAALGTIVLVCNHPAGPWHQPLAVFAAGMLAVLLGFRRWRPPDLYWFLGSMAAAGAFVAVFQGLRAAPAGWPVAVAAGWLAYHAVAAAADGAFAAATGRQASIRSGAGWGQTARLLGVNLPACLCGYVIADLPGPAAGTVPATVLYLGSVSVLALAVTGWLRNRELRRRLSGLVGAARQLPWADGAIEKVLLGAASASVRADQVAVRTDPPAGGEIGVK